MLTTSPKRLRKRPEDIKGKTLTIHCPNKGDKLLIFFIKLRAPTLTMSGNGTVFKEKYELHVSHNYALRQDKVCYNYDNYCYRLLTNIVSHLKVVKCWPLSKCF